MQQQWASEGVPPAPPGRSSSLMSGVGNGVPPSSPRVHSHSGEEAARWGSYAGMQAALPMSGSMVPQQTQQPADPMGAPQSVISRASLNPQFVESHSTLAADMAGRMLEDHARSVQSEVSTLRVELHNLKVERIGRCEEQLFEHRHLIDGLTREKQMVEELSKRVARVEEQSLQHRRGQEAMLHGLDEERHQREIRQEQLTARMDSVMSSVEGTRKQVGRDHEAVMQHVNTMLDERDRRVTQELLESDNFRYLLKREQEETLEKMRALVEDFYTEIEKGISLEVDQKELDEKMQLALEKVRADFDTDGLTELKATMESRCGLLEQSVSKVEESIAAAATEAKATRAAVAQGDVKLKALHALQKLMSRPDAADVFKKFDTDGDGTVDRHELGKGMAQIGNPVSEEELDEIMRLCDKDGDGTCDYTEFAQMGEMKEELKANEDRLRAANDVMKAEMEKMSAALAESSTKMSQLEGAGEEAKRTMVKNEATLKALHIIQKIMAMPDAEAVFHRFDADRSGTVERHELKAGLQQIGYQVTEAELDAMMGLMDPNGDGSVDYSEFVKVGEMKSELGEMQQQAQADNQALAQQLTAISQEKCEAQIAQLRQVMEDKMTRLSGTDQEILMRLDNLDQTASDIPDDLVSTQQLQEGLGKLAQVVQTEFVSKAKLEAIVEGAAADVISASDEKTRKWLKTEIDKIENDIRERADKGDLDKAESDILDIQVRLDKVEKKAAAGDGSPKAGAGGGLSDFMSSFSAAPERAVVDALAPGKTSTEDKVASVAGAWRSKATGR